MGEPTLKFKCPSCEKTFKPIPFLRIATGVYRRTCQNPECKETWQIKATPKPIRQGIVHIGEFTFIERKG